MEHDPDTRSAIILAVTRVQASAWGWVHEFMVLLLLFSDPSCRGRRKPDRKRIRRRSHSLPGSHLLGANGAGGS